MNIAEPTQIAAAVLRVIQSAALAAASLDPMAALRMALLASELRREVQQ
jgi:hypothetical protein